VQVGDGRFEPREVTLGARTDNYVAVTKGVSEGEQVVVAANFLLDAESNLQAAVAGFGPPTTVPPEAVTATLVPSAPARPAGH
jgi:multidrug efflux pump subunit AcrA (membrane-fusion protein)